MQSDTCNRNSNNASLSYKFSLNDWINLLNLIGDYIFWLLRNIYTLKVQFERDLCNLTVLVATDVTTSTVIL